MEINQTDIFKGGDVEVQVLGVFLPYGGIKELRIKYEFLDNKYRDTILVSEFLSRFPIKVSDDNNRRYR